MNFIPIPGKDFEMSDSPVTQKEWQEVMGNNPSYFKGENNPVETVSWNDCQNFIKKLNEKNDGYVYRLPTEEEWEYCAKSCDAQEVMEIAWCWENSEGTTHPVKQKKPNELGLYDMLGNVLEWTSTKEGAFRVFRGSSFFRSARGSRGLHRYAVGPDVSRYNVGGRLVRTKVLFCNPITLDKLEAASRGNKDAQTNQKKAHEA